MTTLTLIFLIALSVLSLTLLILSIYLIITINHFKERMNILSSTTYELLRDNDKVIDSLNEIINGLKVINNNVGSLSSSISNENKKMYKTPTPELAKNIRATIQECINIEVLLAKNMRIPTRNATKHILETVVKTYSDIEPEYLIKLSYAMIEQFLEQVSESND